MAFRISRWNRCVKTLQLLRFPNRLFSLFSRLVIRSRYRLFLHVWSKLLCLLIWLWWWILLVGLLRASLLCWLATYPTLILCFCCLDHRCYRLVVDEWAHGIWWLLIWFRQCFQDFRNSDRQKFIDLLLSHLHDLLRFCSSLFAHILVQSLQSLVLFQKLDDGVVARLPPVQNYGDFHNEFKRISFRSILWQNKIYVIFFTHAIDDVQQILLLDLSGLIVFLIAKRFSWWLLFRHLIGRTIDIIQSWGRLDWVFFCWFDCFERVKKLIECPILLFFMTHLDSLWGCLNHLLKNLNLTVVLAITCCQGL